MSDSKGDSRKSKSKSKKGQSASEIYKKMSQHEHILKLPDSYIGSVEADNVAIWILGQNQNEEPQIIKKEITYVPGLYKIFDEIVVNARDHTVRDPKCDQIRINVDQEKNEISIWNNGSGIPVEIHNKEKIYIPEMIFGNLLTSSNYDTKGKTVGGKNGYGAKLANIYSTHFVVETSDKKNKKHYLQHFYDNMYTIKKPEIKKSSGAPFTRITFNPDLRRFGLEELSDDMVALFKKRAYDVAASTSKNVKVYLNDELLEINSYPDYIKMFYDTTDPEQQPNIIYEEVNDRWKVGVVYDSERGYTHVSSVNGIFTNLGGTHVNHVTEQVLNGINNHIKKAHKGVTVKPAYIKDNLTIFIEAVIEDPSFTSQTKEFMSSKYASFGSRCDLSDAFIKKVIKSGIVDEAVKFAQLKAEAALSKTDGKKTGSVRGIPKLEDAHWAGGKKAKYTRLILTEGDSAKTFAMHGLAVVGREKFGVFPLRGKMLNVRDASAHQLMNNAEIQNLKKILGLKQGVKYEDVSRLRYGGIIILTDQDVDGSHIKGLVINMFHYFWPSLLKIEGFVQSMATPIIKVFKTSDRDMKKPVSMFYNLTDCRKWVDQKGSLSGLKFKYYKGLGTSKPAEAKEVFNELERNIVTYCWNLNGDQNKLIEEGGESEEDSLPEDSESTVQTKNTEPEEDHFADATSGTTKAIVKAFDKHHVQERKKWLGLYNPNLVIENTEREVSFADFIDRELIHFSSYDNIRSIPSVCDGFKPSQRKVLYGSYLRGLDKTELKVAQLAGFVSDKAQYHHGEESLQGTIVGMAQNFVGENNIYLLMPNGNFGSRLMGGKDSSSARYIFTRLNELTGKIFRKEDTPVLEFVEEDGETAEPKSYAPIIPMLLVNGATGIGTGYSTSVPKFNPEDIVKNLKKLIRGKEPDEMYPWYYGHKGKTDRLNGTTFRNRGCIKSIDVQTVQITELPVETWTQNYLSFLDTLIPDDKNKTSSRKFIRSVVNNSGSNDINITIHTRDNHLQDLIKSNQLYKTFKLESNINTSNMVAFSPEGVLRKYQKVSDILEEFYHYRHLVYEKRRKYYIDLLTNQMLILKYKVRFIRYKVDGKIVIEKKKLETVIADLEAKKFPRLSATLYAPEDKKSYQYITSMNMFAVTEEKIAELTEEYNKKKKELEDYQNTPIEVMWERELDEFLEDYREYLAHRETEFGEDFGKKKKRGKKGGARRIRVRAK